MSRPGFDRTILHWIPVKLILVLITIVGIALTALLSVSLERERVLLDAIGAGDGSIDDLPDETRVLLAILIASGTAITTAVIVQHYRTVRRELSRTRDLSQHVLDNLADGVLAFDVRGRSRLINPSGTRILGYGESDPIDVARLAADGRGELARIVSAAVFEESYSRQVDIAVGSGAVPIELSTFPLVDASGERTGVIALVRDMSEVASLENELRTAERLSSLGTLSAGIAHEIKNPLSAIDLNLRLLEAAIADPDESAPVREYFEILREEIDRLNRLVDNVLRFGRPAVMIAAPVDVADVVRRTYDLVSPSCRERSILLDSDFDPPDTVVIGDASSLQQAFMNIILNAIQSMDAGGRILTRLRVATDQSGSWCEVTIRDSGRGIPEEDLARVMEPFFSNKTDGTGLGLSIVHRIVSDHGGSIRIESAVDVGTSATVRLPLEGGGSL